jgi:hypothetical protein
MKLQPFTSFEIVTVEFEGVITKMLMQRALDPIGADQFLCNLQEAGAKIEIQHIVMLNVNPEESNPICRALSEEEITRTVKYAERFYPW